MGCGASAPVQTIKDEVITTVETGVAETSVAKETLNIDETAAVKTKAGNESFIASCLKARAECADNAEIMEDCVTRLQAHNRRLKEYVAIYDAQTVNEAMNGGFLGLGCNDRKLIAALCTRTKSQLVRTRKQYRQLYDRDLRAEVRGEIGSGAYGRMMFFGMAAPDEYVADIIDLACDASIITSLGCDETCLIEVFVTHTQAELQAGKRKWEGRRDKSLIDYISKELTWPSGTYTLLKRLLFLLYKGDRNESSEVDEAQVVLQVGELHEELSKGWFEETDHSRVIEIIGANSRPQNLRLVEVYEKMHDMSLGKALDGKCGSRLHYALCALLLPTPDFLAMRLHDAFTAWFTNKDVLTRLLGGLDGEKMVGVAEAYERKYTQPLWSALREHLSTSSDFYRAAAHWIRSFADPSRGAEQWTEADVAARRGDAPALATTLDFLFLEHEALLVFVAFLDVETIREAVKGWGHDDTALIRAFATRDKRALARVNLGYREAYEQALQELIESELGTRAGHWYSYLAKFLVVQAEQADLMILDLAMDGSAIDHAALVEFLCARHPRRVRAAKAKWEGYHDDSLVDKLADELSGEMQRLALRMLKGRRAVDDDESVDDALARKQAHQLHDGAADYIEVLCDNSAAQNALCARYYEESYDTSLRRAISQEYSGPVKDALLALLHGPSDWYAAQLRAALSGKETNDKRICRILGSHDKEEVKAIAAAYEGKYNEPLKRALTAKCKGNYKRLAVAWVDLPDQLVQPEKRIAVPTKDEVPDDAAATAIAGGGGGGAASTLGEVHVDEELSEDDEAFDDEQIEHTSPLYRAKVMMWTAKYEKYHALGKARKADHYQRLLLAYPPTSKGDALLRGYYESLSAEYEQQKAGDDWTAAWFASMEEAPFEAAGTSRAFFKAWLDVTESMVAEKRVTLTELKGLWGLKPKPQMARQPSYQQAVPLAPYQLPIAAAAPVAQPVAVAQPLYQPPVVAQPLYQPAVPPPVYQPAMPVYQPMMPQAAYHPTMTQPPMFQPMTTTTTTVVSSAMYAGMPMYQPQPTVMYYR